MRTAFVILAIVCLSFLSKAQEQSLMFEKTWGDPQVLRTLKYADELPNGNINLIGSCPQHLTTGAPAYGYMCQIDKNGNVLWEKTLGYSNVGYYLSSIIKTKAGNYLIVGSAVMTSSNILALCIDANGNIIFEQFYSAGYNDAGNAVCETEDSCFMIAGTLGGLPNWETSPALIKIDAQGNEIWRERQDSLIDYGQKYIRVLDDGYLVTGNSNSAHFYNTYIAKYRSDGNLDWIKYPYGLSDTIDTAPTGLFTYPDGRFSIPFTYNYSTYWKQFDASGNFIDERFYETRLCFSVGLTTTTPYIDVQDSSFIITVPPNPNGAYNVLSVDRNQEIQFKAKITDSDSANKYLTYTIRTSDGGLLSVGSRHGSNPSTDQYYLVKFGADGRYQAEDFSETVTAFPNPSSDGKITLSFDMKTDENVSVRIVSSDGRLVYTDVVFCAANSQTTLPVQLDEATTAAGLYFLEATTSTAVYRTKLMVMRSH